MHWRTCTHNPLLCGQPRAKVQSPQIIHQEVIICCMIRAVTYLAEGVTDEYRAMVK